MMNLGGWLNKMSEDLYNEAERDMYNGNRIRGVGKAFLSGTINGVTNGLIVNGIILTVLGAFATFGNKESEEK
nr:MAG TPA: hypothetical protein [Bacteriophage sp.]